MSTDYHDLRISDLEKIAAEQISEAKLAWEAGEEDALRRVQQWSETLAAIRYMKEHTACPTLSRTAILEIE